MVARGGLEPSDFLSRNHLSLIGTEVRRRLDSSSFVDHLWNTPIVWCSISGTAATWCLAPLRATARSRGTLIARATGSTTFLALDITRRPESTYPRVSAGSVVRPKHGLLGGEPRAVNIDRMSALTDSSRSIGRFSTILTGS